MPPVVSEIACMTVPNTQSQIRAARDAVWDRLLSARNRQGHWPGELCSSALSTATAVVALELAKRAEPASDQAGIWARLIDHGADWLLSHQRSDGGWGDTDRSYANIATTMLAQAALTLTRSDDQKAQQAIAAAGVYLQENGLRCRSWPAVRSADWSNGTKCQHCRLNWPRCLKAGTGSCGFRSSATPFPHWLRSGRPGSFTGRLEIP